MRSECAVEALVRLGEASWRQAQRDAARARHPWGGVPDPRGPLCLAKGELAACNGCILNGFLEARERLLCHVAPPHLALPPPAHVVDGQATRSEGDLRVTPSARALKDGPEAPS